MYGETIAERAKQYWDVGGSPGSQEERANFTIGQD